MVTYEPKNFSRYPGLPPQQLDGNRKITGGPLYPLEEAQDIARKADAVELWTKKCVNDAKNLGLDSQDVGALLQKLQKCNYRNSEWCENGKGGWVACDAYALICNERIENTDKIFRMEYFFKFAIGKSGALLLIVSFHLSAG
ncbi:MAG: type II toxin-antitoxin system MqsR family toxin [Gammaproteobacteria bacterium]|nr:type II toxin-antitoxin system MqsR family toxin [Gammaproteobacteria bacterium]